jgi:hypothetical protein
VEKSDKNLSQFQVQRRNNFDQQIGVVFHASLIDQIDDSVLVSLVCRPNSSPLFSPKSLMKPSKRLECGVEALDSRSV